MKQATSAQPQELEVLEKEFIAYIESLRSPWCAENRVHSRDVYEVMCSADREQVHQRIAQWGRYITPLAEAWWKERGYGVTWPADNSQPMGIYKLEAA